MFFCVPILLGCQTKIDSEGVQTPRICPKCHNASVCSAKSSTWFQFFFVPVFPLKTKHIWICTVCQWQVPLQPSWEPPTVGNIVPAQGWTAQNRPGYQPSYTPQK